MKNYYYNPKTQDLTIFDTETKELLVLERLLGIRVLTSSDLDRPGGDEPVKKWHNHNWNPQTGKAKKNGARKAPTCSKCGKQGHRSHLCPDGKTAAPAKKGGKWKCKNCGELGHSAKTCKNPPKQSPPLFPRTPRRRDSKNRP
jgi:hypothetical protein